MPSASDFRQRLSRHIVRYALAIASVGLATLITQLLTPALVAVPSPLFFAAVMISSWYGGRGPGILASLLSTLAIDYYFISPIHELIFITDLPLLLVSTLISILVSSQSVKRHRVEGDLRQSRDELEARVERRTRELAKTNQSLESEVAERKRSNEALLESEERYRELFENANDIVYTLDLSGNLVSLNKAGERITGYAREEMLGRPIAQIVLPEYMSVMAQMMQRKVAGETLTTYEIEVVAKDGSSRIALEVSSRLIHEQGKAVGIQGIARDITERKKAEADLRDKEDRLRLAIESAALGTWDFNPQTRALAWDNACKAIFDAAPDAEINYDMYVAALHPEDRRRALLDAQRAFDPASGGKYDTEYRIIRLRDGVQRWVAARGQAFFNESNQAVRFIGTVLDITERKQAEKDRAQLLAREKAARVEAEEANRLKDEFLATVSHELRTPLNAILGWTELMRGGKLDSETSSRALGIIVRNANSQAQLIDDILDVSRIIAGNLRLEARPVALKPIINAAIETAQPAALAKEIKLEFFFDKSVGSVSGDPNRLQQVVWNLLSNAIKFTPKGGRVVARLQQADGFAEIRVSDTGSGISPAFLPSIFDRFRQADSSYTRQHGGLGLGLAIVQHLVEMHSGSVKAESPGEGLGATLTVKLPLNESRAVDSETRIENAEKPAGRFAILDGLRLLVVDDEADARELIIATLKQYGAEVTALASTAEALGALAKNEAARQPDVILSDIGMPGEDGLALISALRAMERGEAKRIPAIALTAYARAEDRERALGAGFQLHFAKPFDPVALVEAIAAVAGRGGANDAARNDAAKQVNPSLTENLL
jgi:PAS domain S-box-containing protein